MFCKKFQKFLKIYMKEPLLCFFYCKAAASNSLWKSQSKGYLAINFIKKRCLHRDSYTSTFLQVLKKLWTRIWTPLRDCLWNNVKERVCDSEFSHVFFIKKCFLLHQNKVISPGGVWGCELRKIRDTELKFLTIKPIHQKQSPGSVR